MKADERIIEIWMYTAMATVGKARLEYNNAHKRQICKRVFEVENITSLYLNDAPSTATTRGVFPSRKQWQQP
jgi:hypothetical protein